MARARYRESKGLPPKSTTKVAMNKIGKRGKANATADQKTRRAYVAKHGTACGFCPGQGAHLHHVRTKGARPDLRQNLRNLVMLCVTCHDEAHRQPLWARNKFREIRPADASAIGLGTEAEA